ncbi:MAG TPA: YitT family protein [Bacilli bacterium]|nr:YitT family protein [Bacilli bacterium]
MNKIGELLIDNITKRNRIARIIVLAFGCLIVALIYNAFMVPNKVVYGGLGGLAIVINNLTGINTVFLLNIFIIISIIVSLFVLGKKKTIYSLTGYILFAIMVDITQPIANSLTFNFNSYLFSISLAAFLTGLGGGIILRTGFNTGGSDIFLDIMQDVFKIPLSKASAIFNGVIIVLGAFSFGIIKTIYAIICLLIINFITDYVLLGSSTSKMCFINTHYQDKIEKFLKNDLNVGYTLIQSTNGIGFMKRTIIMCIIPTNLFYVLKKEIQRIDSHGILYSNDCYTVEGGKTNDFIPV